MTKTKTTTARRTLALVMTVLMLMTAWVFVAPTKANAEMGDNITYQVYGGGVAIYVYYSGSVSSITAPTWTSANGQDDICDPWYSMSAGSWTIDGVTYNYGVWIPFSNHNFESGEYNTHIYVNGSMYTYLVYNISTNTRKRIAEYHYDSGTNFVYQMILYYKNSGSNNDAAISWLTSHGWTHWGHNFNAGDNSSSCYVHSGYKTTTDPTAAIKGVLVAQGHPSTVAYNGVTYYAVGSGLITQTPNDGDGCVDLNKGNGGDDLYLMATADFNAGPAITALDMGQNSNSDKAKAALTNNGFTVATNQYGNPQDTNEDVGTGSDYNYVGYKSSCTAVASDTLRAVLEHRQWIYNNGGSSNTNLANAINTANSIISDLNDGYTTYTQAQIDSATNALIDAIPTLVLDTDLTLTLPSGGDVWCQYTPSSNQNLIFLTHAGFDADYEYYANYETTKTGNQMDGNSTIISMLGMANYQVYHEISLSGGTTYYFKVFGYNHNSSNSGSLPMRLATPVKVTFNATGGTNKEYNLPKGYSTLKLDKTGVTRSGHTLVGWSNNNTSSEELYKLKSETITVPTSNKTYYALWAPNNAPTLSYSQSYTATIDAAGEIEFYQFTPTVSGKYIIYGTGSTDSYVLRYDPSQYPSTGEPIDVQDDSSNSTNGNTTGIDFGIGGTQFFMLRELAAGTTYWYGVKYYGTGTGSLPFRFEKVYEISYDANGGTDAPTVEHEKFYNRSITLSEDEPTLEHYHFLGWATTDDATEPEYQPGDTCNINDDATLYAVWELDQYNVTLNHSDEGYTVTTAPAATVQHGGSVSFKITLSEHYTNSEAPAVTATNGTVGTPTKNGNEITYTVSNITGDTTITVGEAAIDTFTITWKNWDGTVLKTDTNVAYGTTPQYDGPTPTREDDAQYHYTTYSWDPMVGIVSDDAVYTAQFDYEIKSYTVTWKNWNGTVLETDTDVEYGATPQYNGATPTKTGTAQYAYEFAGWTPEITTVTGDATYTATFTEVENQYTVTWKNEDGTILEKDENVAYGATPQYNGATPTKTGTAQYSYTFAGWNPEITAVTADVTYTATFTESLNKYTVTWVDENDDILETDTEVAYGATPHYDAETPTKASTAQYSYTFAGWYPEITTVTGNATYKATYRSTVNKYDITWLDGDGNEMKTDSVAYGETPVYEGDTPTKTATAQYTYTFNNTWSPEIVAVTEVATYTAQFDATVNKYDITWVDGNGDTLKTDSVAYGETPAYEGDTPTKTATAQYTYTFNNTWTPEIVAVTEAATYTAQFDSTVNKYDITWVDGNGDTLKTDSVAYGETPVYEGDTPTKTATAQYTYTFNNTWTPEIVAVTEAATYTAQFDSTVNKYDITWVDGNGDTLKTDSVAYGETPAYEGDTPTKTATAQYTYTFNNTWTPEIVAVTEAATYTAQFDSTVNKYDITWVDGNGDTLKTDSVAYGETPVYEGDTPTKTATAQYTYTFNNTWTPEIVAVTEAATYTAQFDSTVNKYDITWVDGNGDTLKTDSVAYGETPAYEGDTPTKTATAQYTYTFNNTWTPEIVAVTEAATYTAQFDSTVNKYTVRFLAENGDVIDTQQVEYGSDATPPTDPVKDPDAENHYSFDGWTGYQNIQTDKDIQASFTSAAHTPKDTYETDAERHWIVCSVCGYVTDAGAAHNWQWVVDQKATCDADGKKHESCPICGLVRSEDTVITHRGHDYAEALTTEPTCTEPGEKTFTCRNTQETDEFAACSSVYTAPVDPLGHDLIDHDAKDPTCTQPGNSAYWYCSRCEKYFSDEAGATEIEADSWVISANGHHYGTPTWTWAEDYSKATATFTCEKNDDTQNVIDNEPTTATISEQTCTTAHVVKYTAAVTFQDEPYSNTTAEITLANALGHTWGTPTYTWADDNSSVTATRICGRDGEHKETATVAATYSVVTAAQCGVAGLGRWTSAAFENTAFEAQTKDVTIPALKHDLTFHAATATCQHAGQRSYYECQRCGKLYWDQYGTSEITDPAALNVDKVDHDFNDPGCKIRNNNDRETHSYLCIHECGTFGRREAHVFDQKVIAPDYLRSKASCTSPAVYYMSCACGEKGSATFTVGEALGHHIVPVAAVAATCTKSGNNAYYKCDQCNATFFDELGETPKSEAEFSVAALGHEPYALDIAKSGCTEDGSLKWDAYSCSRCGDYYMRLTVTAFNGDGNKLSNVTVKITDNSGRVNITGTTDETGSFTPNETFRPGTYNFTLSGKLNGVNINHKATVALTAGTVSGTIGAVNAPSTPSTPSDPGSGSGSGSSGSNVCGYCGKVHTGPFGWLIQLIHNILGYFRR